MPTTNSSKHNDVGVMVDESRAPAGCWVAPIYHDEPLRTDTDEVNAPAEVNA